MAAWAPVSRYHIERSQPVRGEFTYVTFPLPETILKGIEMINRNLLSSLRFKMFASLFHCMVMGLVMVIGENIWSHVAHIY